MAKLVAVAADGYAPEKGDGDNGFSHYVTVYEPEDLFGNINPDVEIIDIKNEGRRIEILASRPAYTTDGKKFSVRYRKGVAIVNDYGLIKAWISPVSEYEDGHLLYKRVCEIEWFGAARFPSIEVAAEWVKWALAAAK